MNAQLITIALLTSLTACATAPAPQLQHVEAAGFKDHGVQKERWIEVFAQADLNRICGSSVIGHVSGCYKRDGDVCVKYTRALRSDTDRGGMETLGHEDRHCNEGNFHASMDY